MRLAPPPRRVIMNVRISRAAPSNGANVPHDPESPPPVSARKPSSPDKDGPGGKAAQFFCDLCGGPMLNRHCKLVCKTCGYQRDCSDP